MRATLVRGRIWKDKIATAQLVGGDAEQVDGMTIIMHHRMAMRRRDPEARRRHGELHRTLRREVCDRVVATACIEYERVGPAATSEPLIITDTGDATLAHLPFRRR